MIEVMHSRAEVRLKDEIQIRQSEACHFPTEPLFRNSRRQPRGAVQFRCSATAGVWTGDIKGMRERVLSGHAFPLGAPPHDQNIRQKPDVLPR